MQASLHPGARISLTTSTSAPALYRVRPPSYFMMAARSSQSRCQSAGRSAGPIVGETAADDGAQTGHVGNGLSGRRFGHLHPTGVVQILEPAMHRPPALGFVF